MNLTVDDKLIEANTGRTISSCVKDRILTAQLEYQILNQKEFGQYVQEYLSVLERPLVVAGKHRKKAWENGWKENLEAFKRTLNPSALIPLYHSKSNIARINGEIVKTFTPNFDYLLHSFFIDTILYPIFPDVHAVLEVGCGTGYHLFRWALQSRFNHQQYFGLDWTQSSQKIITEVAQFLGARNVFPVKFDFFHPSCEDLSMRGAAIVTIASLEQTGTRYTEFLKFILKQRPKVCIHFEPIEELLSKDVLLDNLTLRYFRKRRYLSGYLTTLRQLESEKKIRILEVRRLNYGSKFIEGHTLIIWEPAA